MFDDTPDFDVLDRLADHTPADELDDTAARKYAATLERGSFASLPAARKDGNAPTNAETGLEAPNGRGELVGSAGLDGGGTGQTPSAAGAR